MAGNDDSMRAPAPEWMAGATVLSTGDALRIRPLAKDDAGRFGAYLGGLSDRTRSFWGPHAFDQGAANAICAGLGTDPVLRLIGAFDADRGALAAYFLLHRGVRESDGKRYAALGIPLDPDTDGSLAPSVADRYQDRGVGGAMMAHVIAVARKLGRERIVLWDGVQARNERGVHFYTKWGFRKVGEFGTDILNYDMVLRLTP